jgi:hypothetical protein
MPTDELATWHTIPLSLSGWPKCDRMDRTQTGRTDKEYQSSRRPLRRVPIGPMIVIAGLFLPTVSLTSCSGVESSASGIALITAPADEAFPGESVSFEGPSRVSQVVAGSSQPSSSRQHG